MKTTFHETLPEFAAAPIMVRTLRAVLSMHWKVSETTAESRVQFHENPALPVGKVAPLNQAAGELLAILGLSSLALQ